MKPLLTLLATAPAIALAHGDHAPTASDVLHGALHAALSFKGSGVIVVLAVAAYFIFKKNKS
jgi:hypothetical protein